MDASNAKDSSRHLKGLHVELSYKSLQKEKLQWPPQENQLATLTGQKVNRLQDGDDINAMKPHKNCSMNIFYSD